MGHFSPLATPVEGTKHENATFESCRNNEEEEEELFPPPPPSSSTLSRELAGAMKMPTFFGASS
jgi:hypothetical protein